MFVCKVLTCLKKCSNILCNKKVFIYFLNLSKFMCTKFKQERVGPIILFNDMKLAMYSDASQYS